jgi:hypothetical protein
MAANSSDSGRGEDSARITVWLRCEAMVASREEAEGVLLDALADAPAEVYVEPHSRDDLRPLETSVREVLATAAAWDQALSSRSDCPERDAFRTAVTRLSRLA